MFPPTYTLRLCYLRLSFQLASPPGFHVTHISKGNLVYVCMELSFCGIRNFSLPAAGLFSRSRLRGTQRGSPVHHGASVGPGPVARSLGVQSRESWQVIARLLSDQLEPIRPMQTPTCFFFFISSPLSAAFCCRADDKKGYTPPNH